MEISFFKYQGTGNDFVIIDNRLHKISKNNTKLIQTLCDRKFGIGADGLILLEEANSEKEDFTMVYFNADGNQSSMCGNGGRCIVAFAKHLGIIKESTTFSAIDGLHEALIEDNTVGLKMKDVDDIKNNSEGLYIDTGSPHHIIFTEEIKNINFAEEGRLIRNSSHYEDINGTNVNFVKAINQNTFSVRTYERGVEDETLSCGTGVTAVALAASVTGKTRENTVILETLGGKLKVTFEKEGKAFKNIWLWGPAKQVFKGEVLCKH